MQPNCSRINLHIYVHWLYWDPGILLPSGMSGNIPTQDDFSQAEAVILFQLQSCWNTFRSWEVITVRACPCAWAGWAGSRLLWDLCGKRSTASQLRPGQMCTQNCSACRLHVILGIFVVLWWRFPSHKIRINYIFADVQLHMHKQQSSLSPLHSINRYFNGCINPCSLPHSHSPTPSWTIFRTTFLKSPFLKKTPCFGRGVDRLGGCCSHPHPHIPYSPCCQQLVCMGPYWVSLFKSTLPTRAIYQAYKIQNFKTLNFIVICRVRSC